MNRGKMNRRSEMEIYMDILEAVALGKQKPTHILYRANLCWTRLKKKIDFLVRQELLKETNVDGRSAFSLTSKGRDILVYYKKIKGELCHKKRTLAPNI